MEHEIVACPPKVESDGKTWISCAVCDRHIIRVPIKNKWSHM